MNNSEVDYKTLLTKYIGHVDLEEGCNFISRIFTNEHGVYEGMTSLVTFSKEEVEALEECSNLYDFYVETK